MRGELVTPPRLKNRAVPRVVSDIVMHAMAPDVTARYQRATDLLDDLIAAGPGVVSRPADQAVSPRSPRRVEGPRVRAAWGQPRQQRLASAGTVASRSMHGLTAVRFVANPVKGSNAKMRVLPP